MQLIKFIPVKNEKQAIIVENLAKEIWHEYYLPIIGKNQVDYMLKKYQTKDFILSEIQQGCLYFILSSGESFVGYISFLPKSEFLFLSKLYLASSSRGKGYGKQAFAFIENFSFGLNLKHIRLTVNKNNTSSINIYKKAGFEIIDSVKNDIGEGFYMDDYIMQKIS